MLTRATTLGRRLAGVDGPCPQSDSNRHWADFKSAASADWAMGASDECYVPMAKLPEWAGQRKGSVKSLPLALRSY
jgi:hypothetical protein